MCLNRISCRATLQVNVLTTTKHLKKELLVRAHGAGCWASSVCKTEAHAYAWLTQEERQTAFKRRAIVSERFRKTWIKGSALQNGKYCSGSMWGGWSNALCWFWWSWKSEPHRFTTARCCLETLTGGSLKGFDPATKVCHRWFCLWWICGENF